MFRQIKEKIAHKIPRLPRWGRRGIALLSAVSCIAFSGLTASAETPVYFRYARPTVTDNSCYLEIAYDNTYYVLYVTGYYDSPDGNKPIGKNFFMCSTLDETNLQLTYYAYGKDGTEMSSYISAFWVSSDGRIWSAPYNRSKGRLEFTIGPSTRELVRFYGVDPPWSSSDWGASDIVYVYGEDTIINQKIDLINSTIQSFQGQNQQQLQRILAAIVEQGNSNTQQIKDNADKNANEIKKNQDDNSQKIINNQNELQQKEKDETQQSGDKSTKDTQKAIPTVNEGFGSALKSFVASMSYNGTEAHLPIPRAYLPAINGVTEEITLIPEQNYDMSQAINEYLPETLLQLIRHLFTIALILYCVYELYGLIQYVLTLRKGGKED